MHELSIAMSILEVAREEADRRGGRVAAIHVEVGPLSGVIREALEPAYEIAAHGTEFEGTRLVVKDVPVVVFCPSCRERREPPSLQWLACPVCGTPAGTVLQGAELQITALEIEEDEQDEEGTAAR